jgi:hypothetical protein
MAQGWWRRPLLLPFHIIRAHRVVPRWSEAGCKWQNALPLGSHIPSHRPLFHHTENRLQTILPLTPTGSVYQ